MNAKTFWKNTNDLIKKQNKTQRGLAIECGFTERRIESLSARSTYPDLNEAVLIASTLGVTVEYLVTGSDSNPYKKQLDKLKASIISLLNEPPEEQK